MLKNRGLFFLSLLFSLSFISGAERAGALAQSKRVGGGDIAYAKVRVRRTGILFPRLTRFADRRVMREVNRQIDELTAQFGCEERGRNSYYHVRSRVEYAERDIFSIYSSAEYYCNTAYPTNDANQSLTFDLRTGKQVQFEELFRNYEADKREILRTIFAEQVARSERLAASGRPGEESCEGDPELYSLERLEGSTFAFNFSRAGLRVQPEWPHVIEACAIRVTVPYSKLARLAAPDGLLMRAAR